MRTWMEFSERIFLLPDEIDLSALITKSKKCGGCSVDLCSNIVWATTKNCSAIDTIWVYLKLYASFFRLGLYILRNKHLSALIHFWWFWVVFYNGMVRGASEELYRGYYANSMDMDHTCKELKSDLESELSKWRTVSVLIVANFIL